MISNEILLIFFALPIAVVIISIALQRIFKNPILVAAIIFAIFLIVTFVIDNIQFLIAAIAYTILSYITAFLTCVICRCINSQNQCCNPCRHRNNNNGCNNGNSDNNSSGTLVNTISTNNELVNTNLATNDAINNSQGCGCGNNNDNNNEVLGANGISARINIIPNNNGVTGNINGCYRRR